MSILSEIKKRLPDFVIPGSFNSEYIDRTESYYLASCSEYQFVLVDDSFESVTGHPASAMLGKGSHDFF
jgi:hypothetical protein